MQQAQARPPYVTFEIRSEEDRTATIESGIYVAKDVHFAIITPQGSKDRIERRVDEWFPHLEQQVRESRFEQSWLDSYKSKYEAWSKGQEIPENGHPVVNWPAASPAQVKTLLAAGVRTLEDLAVANEEVIARLGMGARALKARAAEWLAAPKDHGAHAEQVAALKQQNIEQQEQIAALTLQVAGLLEAAKAAAATTQK